MSSTSLLKLCSALALTATIALADKPRLHELLDNTHDTHHDDHHEERHYHEHVDHPQEHMAS